MQPEKQGNPPSFRGKEGRGQRKNWTPLSETPLSPLKLRMQRKTRGTVGKLGGIDLNREIYYCNCLVTRRGDRGGSFELNKGMVSLQSEKG